MLSMVLMCVVPVWDRCHPVAAWRKRGRPATSWSGTNPGTEAFVPIRVTERGAPPMLAIFATSLEIPFLFQ